MNCKEKNKKKNPGWLEPDPLFPLSSQPLGEQQEDATRRQIDFDLFCFPCFFTHFTTCCLDSLHAWDFMSGSGLHVYSDSLQIFTAFDSLGGNLAIMEIFNGFFLHFIRLAQRNAALLSLSIHFFSFSYLAINLRMYDPQ